MRYLMSFRAVGVEAVLVTLLACNSAHGPKPEEPAPPAAKTCDPLFDDCPDGQVCVAEAGCKPVVCTVEVDARCADADTVEVCNDTGTGFDAYDCTAGRSCDTDRPMLCVGPLACAPGDMRCIDGTHTEVCDTYGQGWVPGPDCTFDAEGRQCYKGGCRTQCEIAELSQSYIGCEYWGADLGNLFTEPDDIFTFAFAVSNALPTLTAEVELQTEAGVVDSLTVEPGKLGVFRIGPDRPRNLSGSQKRLAAYRIVSSVPVAAYQFNPLETAEYNSSGDAIRLAASTDASMLLPSHVLDDRYLVVAWPQNVSTPSIAGSLMAVAAAGAPVDVTVSPTAYSAVGFGLPNATTPGTDATYHLEPFEVLQLTTVFAGQGWTGTRVSATGKVAVFGGNECARVPSTSNFCDHLEEQLFGLTAWGKAYVATKSWPRGEEADIYRIIAEQDGTQLLFHPDSVSGPKTLAAGQKLDITTTADFVVTANKPVLVTQFFTGSGTVVPGCDVYTCSETGDPSMVQLPPVDQYRDVYVFLNPDTYQQDFINVVEMSDTELYLDGELVTEVPVAIGSSGYSVLRLRVADGPHIIEGSQGFGLLVYGYGGNDGDALDYDTANVSYAYPGGLNFLPLNPKE